MRSSLEAYGVAAYQGNTADLGLGRGYPELPSGRGVGAGTADQYPPRL